MSSLPATARPAPDADVPRAGRPVRGSRSAACALAAWALLVAVAIAWGRMLAAGGGALFLDAPPLHGSFRPRAGLWTLPAIAAAGAVVLLAPRFAATAPWRRVLLAGFAGAAVWAVALALADGPGRLTAPLTTRYDYRHDLPRVEPPGRFLETYTADLPDFAVHVRGHPPGMMLVLWSLDRAGLSGAGWAAALVIGAGASAVPAVLVAAREVAGEARARSAAPYLAAAPMAIWVATSADALFLGVGAWSATLIILATGRRGRRAGGLALAGGLLFGAALFLTYGAALLAAIVLAVAAARQRAGPLTVAAGGALAVAIAFWAAGFSWPEGLLATRRSYLQGAGGERPYGYFLLANIAAFGLALGPAAAAALGRLRDRPVWLLAGAALAAVALADLSGMSKGEVERIWLPFAPWVLVATSALPRRGLAQRRWLALQVAAALLIQVLVLTSW